MTHSGEDLIAIAEKLFISYKEKTFQYDESLPSLPVPDLYETMQKYLKSLEPLVTKEEYANTYKIIQDFQNGIGIHLQEKLKERALEKKNWLHEWWSKYAYLSFREPLAPCMNMAGIQSLHFTLWESPSEKNALEISAESIWAFLHFYNLIRLEMVKPHQSRKGDRLSMDQYRNIFNTTRIPKEEFDEVYLGFKTKSEGNCPRHIIVLCYGHIWFLDPWDCEGKILAASEIEQQLTYIRDQSETLGNGPGISALTADKRDVWAKNRNLLVSLSDRNAEHLSLIESSISVFTIDENCPKDVSEVLKFTLCGEPQNRWADKSYSGVSYKNGYIANNCDHTPFDAMVLVVMGYFQHELLTEKFRLKYKEESNSKNVRMPRRLIFDIDNSILESIEKAKALNLPLRENIDVKFYKFTNYGKKWIKENQIHPDAFIQCALQLAYYQLHHKFAPTYETATTRKFYKARTETIRSCTTKVTEWVQSMMSNTSSSFERKSKLIVAINRHKELALECENGNGIDRHLMGLGLIAYESGMEIPELFTAPSFAKSGGGGNFVLSTSTVGSTYVIGGVAAMVPDGYGIFYGLLPEKIHFMLTNFKNGNTNLNGLIDAINDALTKMYIIISTPHSNL